MTSERGKEFGFAAAHDAPIPYLQRIRDYYQALGYGPPTSGHTIPRCRSGH